jgi:hypothetical protein
MSKTKIYTFTPRGSQLVDVFIENLPEGSIATVYSTVKYYVSSLLRSWFIFFLVQSEDGRIEYFYQFISDSNKSQESHDYVLNIDYDSSKPIFSLDSTQQIVFVNSNNDEIDQNRRMFYEHRFNDEFKIFLIVFRNNIVLFWNNNYAEVVVKFIDFSSFLKLWDYDFTRVVIKADDDNFLCEDNCSITFYMNPSVDATYVSVNLKILSLLICNDVSVVVKEHTFDQPDKCKLIDNFTLKMSHLVDDDFQKNDSDDRSEAESERR